MKKCLFCSHVFPVLSISCPACGWQPVRDEHFLTYAPDLAQESSGFRAAYFADLAQLESRHFWFRGRNRLILWALEKYCSGFGSFLEIGCGTGYVLSGIAEAHAGAKLYGSEIFIAGLDFAAKRQPEIEFMQMDARNIPFAGEFDAIGAFDVLEHIEEDEQVLVQMHDALKPAGIVILTIPQHTWLWSPTDDYACHVRRYSAKELHVKVKAAGFEILRSTSFVSSLLPAMYASRLLERRKPAENLDPTAELRISSSLNFIFSTALKADIALICAGIDLPVGGSRLMVARKSR